MGAEAERLLKGWVEVRVAGDGAAFLREAWALGLDLRRVAHTPEGLRLYVGAEQLPQLRQAAGAARCRLRFGRRFGLPFAWLALKRRPLLALGGLLLAGALSFVCSLIGWVGVEAVSNEALSREESQRVLDLAAQAGLTPGVSRWRIDMKQVEKYIADSFPELYYVEITGPGRRVTVEVARRTQIPEGLAQPEPGDILAACAGVVEEVLVLSGTAAVEKGDTVLPGQVLVWGWQKDQPIAARAIVAARVWSQASGSWPLQRIVLRETGESCRRLSLRWEGGALLRIWGPKDSPYELAWQRAEARPLLLWRNIPLPVEIVCSEVCQLSATEQVYSPERALELARREALLEARRLLLTEQSWASLHIQESWPLNSQVQDGMAQAAVVTEALADIGVYQANGRTQAPEELLLPEEGGSD